MNQAASTPKVNPKPSSLSQSKGIALSVAIGVCLFLLAAMSMKCLDHETGPAPAQRSVAHKPDLPTWNHKQNIADLYRANADINADEFKSERIGPLMQFAGQSFAHHTFRLNGQRYRDKVYFSDGGRIVKTERQRLKNF